MNFFEQVYETVKKIPRGKVASYGLVAALCGSPRAARQVGWALHQLDRKPDLLKSVPWHRVVNSKGYISTTCHTHTADMQKTMLEQEGIKFKKNGGLWQLDLQKHLWQNRNRENPLPDCVLCL